jgi:putative membrane protein
MIQLSAITLGIVAAIHLGISAFEMFCWMIPPVHRLFGFTTPEGASKALPIVRNVGLYNAFIASGLIWGLIGGSPAFEIRVFFLVCVIVAGIFGAVTLPRTRFPIPTTLLLQTLPGVIALIAVWAARPSAS